MSSTIEDTPRERDARNPVAQRRAWMVSAVSLILAAVSGGVATYLWWLPCRGRMLVGTSLGPELDDSLLTPACTDRMNEGTPFPLPTEAALDTPGLLALSTVTVALVGLGWVVPSWSAAAAISVRLGLALPGLCTWGVAGVGLGIAYGSPSSWESGYGLAFLLNLVVVVISSAWIAHAPRDTVRIAVLGLAVSSVGFLGIVAQYMVMVHWSEANWDEPPGSGYLTAGFLLVCGLVIMIMTLTRRTAQRPITELVLQDVGR